MTRRDRVALSVVVGLALVAAYWFLLLAPKREEANEAKAEVAAVQKRLDDARALVAASKAARASYAANYTAVARLGKAVPADDDLGSLVYQLDGTGTATGVDFRMIKLSTAASAAPPPAPAPAPPAGGAKPPAAGGTTPAGQPAAPTQAATAALPPGAVVGPAGLATMPFSFQFQGGFANLASFFGRTQRYVHLTRNRLAVSGRLLTVDGIGVTFSEQGYPEMEGTITATAYVLPPTQGLTNGSTPSAPSQAGSQPVANQGSGAPTAPATVVPR